jgi:recombinational DNA repair protein (RecF pathway)
VQSFTEFQNSQQVQHEHIHKPYAQYVFKLYYATLVNEVMCAVMPKGVSPTPTYDSQFTLRAHLQQNGKGPLYAHFAF